MGDPREKALSQGSIVRTIVPFAYGSHCDCGGLVSCSGPALDLESVCTQVRVSNITASANPGSVFMSAPTWVECTRMIVEASTPSVELTPCAKTQLWDHLVSMVLMLPTCLN